MEFNADPYPKTVDGALITGELTEVSGWLPEGEWLPPSDEELEIMARTERIARIHYDELPAIMQLAKDNAELDQFAEMSGEAAALQAQIDQQAGAQE